MSYVEITARLKLQDGSESNPERDPYLCPKIKEEVIALLDRLAHHNSRGIGMPSEFDLKAPLLVKVVVVDQPIEPFKPE